MGGKKKGVRVRVAGGDVGKVAKMVENVKVDDPEEDCSKDFYGVCPMHQSQSMEGPNYTEIHELFDKKYLDHEVCIRARLHRSRAKGKLCFIVLRDRQYLLQCVLSTGERVSKAMLKFVGK